MSRRIVFIHGAWVTSLCWEPMVGYFRARGYECVAPAWPGKDRPVEAIRADPSPLMGLGIGEIAAHYEGLVRGLDEPPILIGHSFGGLIVQLLLDRGLGAAGVAIDSAPPSGVWAFEPTAFRSLASVLLTWRGWRKVVRWSPAQFAYAFVNTLAPAEQQAAYDTYVTPETGRIFFQGALASMTAGSPCRVDFKNAKRAPLLLVAGGADHIVPPVINRRNYRKYAGSGAVTAFREFPGRSHWTLAQDGWQDVAEAIAAWLESPTAG
ncbi:MAG: alpha/beta hydrolase [Candidatus Limnocylindrales bacterium]